MKSREKALAIMMAAILVLSVGITSGSFFNSQLAFADSGKNDGGHGDDDDNDDDNSGKSSEGSDKGHGDDTNDSKGTNDDRHDDDVDKLVGSLGENSKAEIHVEDDGIKLEAEIEDGDLADGIYDIVFSCTSPEVDQAFDNALEVKDGHGDAEIKVSLSNGTYSGCEVKAGELSAALPMFTVIADEEEEDDKHGKNGTNGISDEHGKEGRQQEQESKAKIEVEDDDNNNSGIVDLEIDVRNAEFADGTYDAIFVCANPSFSMNLTDAYEVKDGSGKIDTEFGLGNGTYDQCTVTVHDASGSGNNIELASFDKFTVPTQSQDNDDDHKVKLEDKKKERRQALVSNLTGSDIHEKHLKVEPASPGKYNRTLDYMLMANGTAAMDGNSTASMDAQLKVDMAVWKSTPALVIMDVTDGTVQVGNHTYSVVVGYAFYLINQDSVHVRALAVSDSDPTDILKLSLRGSGAGAQDESGFPTEHGDSIDMTFPGSNGPSKNELSGWKLTLEGTLEA